jgi:hypothetical protein
MCVRVRAVPSRASRSPSRSRKDTLNRTAKIVVLALGVLLFIAVVLFARSDEEALQPAAPATLADYWRGDARWAFERKLTAAQLGQAGPQSGAHMEVKGHRWYLFNRVERPGTCPSGEPRLGVQVRESRDRGATWSAPVIVLDPTPGSAWSCAASDGDAFYDEARGKWLYLFQCKPDGGGWNGCYAERAGRSPMGPFAANTENPVIRAGDLWGAICDAEDDCGHRTVVDEGTFNVFDYDGRYFWISFHGSDGVHGYRGIAKTPDFGRGSYVVDRPDEGVPSDGILDAGDAVGFQEQWAPSGPIGAGAGTIVHERDHLYTLNEFPDISLRCTNGQNWDLGMFRSDSTASVHWEPFPRGNPIVASSRAPETNGQPLGCNVLYPTLFRDPSTGSWYLMHGRATTDPANDGLYIYRLVRNTNLLENGDFARGNTWGWTYLPVGVTNVDLPRLPNGSPDGTSYLAFNCGAPTCAPDTSVFQDVPINPGLAGRRVDYGGTLRTDGGEGTVTMAVHQLDAAGALIHTNAANLRIGPGFADHVATGRVLPGARRLRYQLYPKTSQTFAADNLFLRVTPGGCASPGNCPTRSSSASG